MRLHEDDRRVRACVRAACRYVNRPGARYCARCGERLVAELSSRREGAGRALDWPLFCGMALAGVLVFDWFGIPGLALWSGIGLIVLGGRPRMPVGDCRPPRDG